MTETQVIKCPICGCAYRVYMFTTADQSSCKRCQKEADGQGVTTWNPWPLGPYDLEARKRR